MERGASAVDDIEIIEVEGFGSLPGDISVLPPTTAVPSSPITSQDRLRIDARQNRAYELRVYGLSLRQIADMIREEGIGTPHYGEDNVRNDIQRVIEKRRLGAIEDIEEVVVLELSRLDELQEAWYGRAIGRISDEIRVEVESGIATLREALVEARERLNDGRAETARDLRALVDTIRNSIDALVSLHERIGPDARAAKVVLSVMERRAKLLGLDAVQAHAAASDTQVLHVAAQVATMPKEDLRRVMQNLALAQATVSGDEVIVEFPSSGSKIIEQPEE